FRVTGKADEVSICCDLLRPESTRCSTRSPPISVPEQGGRMRIQSGQLVALGYGAYVRSDEVVAVEPITEGRGPGRRSHVWVRGVPEPIVASRAHGSIVD